MLYRHQLHKRAGISGTSFIHHSLPGSIYSPSTPYFFKKKEETEEVDIFSITTYAFSPSSLTPKQFKPNPKEIPCDRVISEGPPDKRLVLTPIFVETPTVEANVGLAQSFVPTTNESGVLVSRTLSGGDPNFKIDELVDGTPSGRVINYESQINPNLSRITNKKHEITPDLVEI